MRILTRAKRGRAIAQTAIVAAACMATACTTDPATLAGQSEKPDTGKWQFETLNDPVTGAAATSAYLVISKFDFPRGNVYQGGLRLMCFKQKPVVRFKFNLRLGTDKTGAIAYRFDDNPGRDLNARFFARDRTIVIDDPEHVASFVGELARATTLTVRVTRLTAGGFTARFPVHNAAHAIAKSFAHCPLPQDRSRTRTGDISPHRLNLLSSRTTFAASRGVRMRPSAQSRT